VKFCDASATYCTDIHLFGTEQLSNAGTATLKFVPGVGSHSYKAVFVGTTSVATSASSDAGLTVTASAKYPTVTTIAQSGSAGSYTLTATVAAATGVLASPTGTVSFLDTSNGNAVLGTAALGAGTTGLSFFNSSNSATGIYPQSVAVGDFNGDGIPDLAVGNLQGDGVTILLGNGDGTFTAAASLGPGNYISTSVAVADFNGDGKADIAVTNSHANVSVFLGNGDGTFTLQSNSRTGSYPVAIAVGDFNRDGIPDLAVADQQEISNGVTILLGNGDGTFTAAASPETGSLPNSVAVGDFNGDGIPDLAIDNGDGTITIRLARSRSSGRFQWGRQGGPGVDERGVWHGNGTSGQWGWNVHGGGESCDWKLSLFYCAGRLQWGW
jgi:DNA/RNA endonuclease YhcR with UshA esterase domain